MLGGAKTRQAIWPGGGEIAGSAAPAERADARDLRDLARRAVAGDRPALQALFSALFPIVHKHLSFVLGFSPLVDDAVQESMLHIHRALPGFRGDASLPTWALTIASRTAARYVQRERKHQIAEIDRAIGDSLYGHDSAAVGSELRLLVQALGKLTLKKRLAFVLFAILDCSATEAGAILDTSPNTAASRYRHARQELLDLVERDDRH